MAEFERGDIVVYCWRSSQYPLAVGVGLVEDVRSTGFDNPADTTSIKVALLSANERLRYLAEVYTHESWWGVSVWEKVGHIDLPPEAPHDRV